jgi:hypothetical protein
MMDIIIAHQTGGVYDINIDRGKNHRNSGFPSGPFNRRMRAIRGGDLHAP